MLTYDMKSVTPLTAPAQSNKPDTGGASGVPPGSLGDSSAAGKPSYVNKPSDHSVSPATGIRLTRKQQLMADLEALMGVYLEIFTMSRLAARENNTFIVMSAVRAVELVAAKMMSAALKQFIGGVVQGALGIASGGMQVFSALNSLRVMQSGMAQMKHAVDDMAVAKQKLKLAENKANSFKASEATHEKADVDSAFTAAKQDYLAKKQIVDNGWKEFATSHDFKEMEAYAAGFLGASAAIKSTGDLTASILKYQASADEKDKMLVDALLKYLQGAEQNSKEFEHDLGAMIKMLLDQMKTKIDNENQLNMSLAKFA